MPFLKAPVVTLEEVRLRKVTLSSLDLEVIIRVNNPNIIGITLRQLPFSVECSSGQAGLQLACGNTGQVKIAGSGSTVLCIPVTSQNAALINALATFVMKGAMQVTIRGTAIIDAILFGWSVLFEKTLPVTREQVADSVAGRISSG